MRYSLSGYALTVLIWVSWACHPKQDEPAPQKATWQLADSLARGSSKLMVAGRLHEKGFLAAITAQGVWAYDSLGVFPSFDGKPTPPGPVRLLTTTFPLDGLDLRYNPVWNNRYVLTSLPGESLISLFNYSSSLSRSGPKLLLNQLIPDYSPSATIYSLTGDKPYAAFNDKNQCLIPVRDSDPNYAGTGLTYALLTLKNDTIINRAGFGPDALTSAKKIYPLADYIPAANGSKQLPRPFVESVFGFHDRFFVTLSNDSHFNNMILSDGTVKPLPLARPARFFVFADRIYAVMNGSAGVIQVMYSPDAGDTWSNAFTITGNTSAGAMTFTEIDQHLYVFVDQQLWQVNSQTGQFTELSVAGLEKSTIKAVVRYGSWVYAMTLSGLYRLRARDFPNALIQP